MYPQERPTIINDVTTILNDKTVPSTGDTEATSQILQRISQSGNVLKPYNPPAFCQYPDSARRDELSFNKGLGQLSLQPAIDQLNSFKQACIKAIKAQFNAMGPESTKDSKLSAGAVEMLNEIYQAAKCFTSIVTNVNNLVNTYIQAIDLVVVQVVQKITQLEQQSYTLMNNLQKLGPQLLTVIDVETFNLINEYTGIADIIKAVALIETQMNAARQAVWNLQNSPERFLMHMEVSVTMLRNCINGIQYCQAFQDILGKSKANANANFMVDSFLDDVDDLSVVNASSYNWSLTNSSALTAYNPIDTLGIIPKLNTLFNGYNGLTTGVTPVIIASQAQSGYIVVPDGEIGLISAGLDPQLGTKAGLVFELSINNGDTIIRAIAMGVEPTSDDSQQYIHENYGHFYARGEQTIEYNKVVPNGTNTWDLYPVSTDLMPTIGTYFYFNDPMTLQPWSFSWEQTNVSNTTDPTIVPQVTDCNVPYTFPVLYLVTNVTHNCVTVQRQLAANLNIIDFVDESTLTAGANYVATDNPGTIPGDLVNMSGQMVIYAKTITNTASGEIVDYILADSYNNTIPYTDALGNTYLMTISDYIQQNPTTTMTQPANDTAAASWLFVETSTGKTYQILNNTLYTVTLNQYQSADDSLEIPHTGEQIPCLNWQLSVYPIGDPNIVRNISFASKFPSYPTSMFFLKAHWGFIPQDLDVASAVNQQNTTTANNVAANLFGS